MMKARALDRQQDVDGKQLYNAAKRGDQNASNTDSEVVTTAAHDQVPAPIATVNMSDVNAFQRKSLATGPLITIFVDNESIATIQRGILNATSVLIHNLVNLKNELHLAANLDKSEVLRLLHWLDGATKANHIPRVSVHGDFVHTLRLYRAANALGLSQYIDKAYGRMNYQIRSKTPSEEELAEVDGSPNNIITMVAGRIGYLIRLGILEESD